MAKLRQSTALCTAEAFLAMSFRYNADNHKKLEEFYKDKQLQETIALEKDKDVGVEVSDKGKQLASKLDTRRGSSHVQKLKRDSEKSSMSPSLNSSL